MFNRTGAGSVKFLINNSRKQRRKMAIVFAVFLVALLAVFLRPEGRADRFARTSVLFRRGSDTGRALINRGSAVVDRLSADLAKDETPATGLDGLIGPADPAPVAPTAE